MTIILCESFQGMSLMAMFLGSRNFGAIGPIVLILVGAWLLFRAMPRSNPV